MFCAGKGEYESAESRRFLSWAWTLVVVLVSFCFRSPAAQAPSDSTAAVFLPDSAMVGTRAPDSAAVAGSLPGPAAARVVSPAFVPAAFAGGVDSVSLEEYRLRHAFSLDQFLEFQPGFVLNRQGPIGMDASLSRYGIGRGRCLVLMGGIPVNNPQNDVAPLAHFPVSGVGALLVGSGVPGEKPAADGLEGYLQVVEITPPESRPGTFIEVSKGKNNLRQRRVRFSSAQSSFGLDLGYDELLNDGYHFDVGPVYSAAKKDSAQFGRSRSRHHTMNLRGELPGDEQYQISFRKFMSTATGDLTSVGAEHNLDGYLASLAATLKGFKLTVFGRGYDADTPDSSSANQTTAVYADWRLAATPRRHVSVGTGFEDIVADMNIRGSRARPRLRKSTARVGLTYNLGVRTTGRVQFSGADYHGLCTGWGGSVEISRGFGQNDVSLGLRKGYRMPNLGELFVPPPAAASGASRVTLGNRYLDNERSWEGGGRVVLRYRSISNDIRLTAIQVEDPILPAPYRSGGQDNWFVTANGPRERLAVLEERLRVRAEFRGLELDFAGSACRTAGKREGYFVSVPSTSVLISARLGGNLFEATSALYLGAEYAYSSSRSAPEGGLMPSYNVFNFKLDGRLLDADMYLVLLNAFNEFYETANGFYMTPRTFVYGIAWTLFE